MSNHRRQVPVPGAVIGFRKNGEPIRVTAGGAPGRAADLPTDPTALTEAIANFTDEQLTEIEGELVSEFDTTFGEDGSGVDADGLARLSVIGDQITSIRGARETRETEAARRAEHVANLRSTVHANEASTEGEQAEETVVPGVESQTTPQLEAIAAAVAGAVTAALGRQTANLEVTERGGPNSGLNRHLRLGQIAQHAPNANVPDARPGVVLTASADIPGTPMGSQLNSYMDVAQAMHERVRNMPISDGNGQKAPVASLHRNFRYNLGLDSTPEQINEVLVAAADVDTLVAAGGWCAPSEISYDFFNVVCEDGLLDLPSVGVVNRGGIRFPTSASMNDIVAASPDGLWTWTEANDIAAVTGGASKECVRIPCPTFNEVRLACDGLCVTAGNLMDFAYPENIANFLRLLMAARAHLTNTGIIATLVANSSAVTMAGPTGGFTGDLMNAIDVQAYDYRNRYAMCNDAVLEVVLPEWVHGPLRSDWARRTGIDDPTLTDALIASMFDERNVRVQYVQDWQTRAANKPGNPAAFATNWPTTVQFMIYAPGTFVKGQGLTLNLGVVRDSVLNSTNDHTAAWSEDCYLVAKPGHESRIVTANICVAGTTGAAEISCGA